GLRKGDVILEFEGRPVAGQNDMFFRVAEVAPGTSVTLKTLREKRERDLKVVMGERPPFDSRIHPRRIGVTSPIPDRRTDMNALWLSAVLLCAPVADDVRYPAKPGPRDFILDEAKLLKPEDAAQIKTLCDEALTKKRAPIVVLTIPSLA